MKSRVAVSSSRVGTAASTAASSSSDQNDLSPGWHWAIVSGHEDRRVPIELRLRVGQGVPVFRVDDHCPGASGIHAKGDGFGPESPEEWHVHQPRSPGGESGDPALHLPRKQPGDAVPRPQTGACEYTCRLCGFAIQLAICPPISRPVLVPDRQRQPTGHIRVAGARLVSGVEVIAERIAVQPGLDGCPCHQWLTFAVAESDSTAMVTRHAAAMYAASAHWPSVAEASAVATNGAGALNTTPPPW